jgi:hypothetical protein
MLKKIKQSSKKQSAFSKKWAKVEKKQTSNLNYKNKLNKLYLQFQTEILPFEHQLCEAIAQQTYHLMGFISRKSFTNWQREELTVWIESNLETLKEHPFVPDGLEKTVRKEYNHHLNNSFKVMDENQQIDPSHIVEMRNLLSELEIPDDFSDQQLVDFIRNPNTFTEHIEKIMAERMSQEEDNQYFEDDLDDQLFEGMEDDFINSGHFQHFQQSHQKHQKKLKDLFNASLLKKCYKKLANILHPDKEPNLDLKEQKSDLMAILVQAKKDKDAFTIISMYQEHVPDNDLNLDKDVSTELLELIDEKLKQLDNEHQQFKNEPSIENMIWQKLGGSSKKVMAEKQSQHLFDLQHSNNEIQDNIINSRNMKQLNKQLSVRYDLRHQNPFSDFEALMANVDSDEFFSNFPFK